MNPHSTVRFAPMADPIDDNRFLFNLKQYPIISNTQSILRGKIGELLYISFQVIAHFLNSCKDPSLDTRGQTFDVSYRFRFELDIIFHNLVRASLSSLGERAGHRRRFIAVLCTGGLYNK